MKKKISFISLLVCLLCCKTTVNAQQVNQEEAESKALSFFKKSNESKKRKVNASSSVELAYKSVVQGETCYYIYNSNDAEGGFVIIGGDEAAREILGYCSNGHFDYATAPDNMKWWLSQYEGEIHTAIKKIKSGKWKLLSEEDSMTDKAKTKRKVAAKQSIPNLLKTTWNQDYPYNSEIPNLYPGSPISLTDKTNRPVTGCVATAMSQIMYYHKTPATTGVGSKSYITPFNSVSMSADFGATTYDWDNMLLSYSKNESVEENKAVGTLLYHCGVSVNMDYKPSNYGGSSASSENVANALVSYFGYDKSVYNADRKFYSDNDWEELIYNELAANRPVLYSGRTTGNSGHAFVCHGYNATDNLFAINWGWGSFCDGYFPLTGTGALQPNGSGIGGAGDKDAYDQSQIAVINIMPYKGSDMYLNVTSRVEYKVVEGSDTISVFPYVLDRSSIIDPNLKLSLSPKNDSYATASFKIGVMFKENTTGKEYICGQVSISELPSGNFFPSYNIYFNTSSIPYNGTYSIYPVISPTGDDGTWKKMMCPATQVVPTYTIKGATDDAKIPVTLSIDDYEIEVYRSTKINHSATYPGTIKYTTSNPSIATVSNDGVVTGVAVGNVKISVECPETDQFVKTTQDFDIKVSATKKGVIEYELSNNELNIGETASITCSEDYTGGITYTSSDNNIVTVSTTGVITAKAAGTATIKVMGDGDKLYFKTYKELDITVKSNTVLPEGIVITKEPVAGMYNFISESTHKCDITFKNNTSSDQPGHVYYKLRDDDSSSMGGSGYANMPAGFEGEISIDLNYDFTPGKSYTVYLYREKDESFNLTSPYNYPSVTFKYVNDITINYTMTNAGYGTICLPFDHNIPEGLSAYECKTYTDDGFAVVSKVKSLKANTPYILRGTAGSYSFTGPDCSNGIQTAQNGLLTGVLVNNYKLQSNNYVLQNHEGKIGFYIVGDGNKKNTDAKQYSCLLTLPSFNNADGSTVTCNLSALYFEDNDETTAIENCKSIEEENVISEIYTVNGIRTNSLQKGINIVRTRDNKVKKILVK